MAARKILFPLLLAATFIQPASAEVLTFTTRATGLSPILGVPSLFPGTSSPIPLEVVITSSFDTETGFAFPDFSTMGSRSASAWVTLTIGTQVYNFSGDPAHAHVQILEHEGGFTTVRHDVTIALPNGSLNISSGIVQEQSSDPFHTVPEMIERGSGTLPNIYGSMYLNMTFPNGRHYITRPEMQTYSFTAVSAVPEPSRHAMLAAGLLVMGGSAARARHRRSRAAPAPDQAL